METNTTSVDGTAKKSAKKCLRLGAENTLGKNTAEKYQRPIKENILAMKPDEKFRSLNVETKTASADTLAKKPAEKYLRHVNYIGGTKNVEIYNTLVIPLGRVFNRKK